MWGNATLAIEESSTSIKVASVTVSAIAQGFARGRQLRSAADSAGWISSREAVAVAMQCFYLIPAWQRAIQGLRPDQELLLRRAKWRRVE